jgi:hypothetical protein
LGIEFSKDLTLDYKILIEETRRVVDSIKKEK